MLTPNELLLSFRAASELQQFSLAAAQAAITVISPCHADTCGRSLSIAIFSI